MYHEFQLNIFIVFLSGKQTIHSFPTACGVHPYFSLARGTFHFDDRRGDELFSVTTVPEPNNRRGFMVVLS